MNRGHQILVVDYVNEDCDLRMQSETCLAVRVSDWGADMAGSGTFWNSRSGRSFLPESAPL